MRHRPPIKVRAGTAVPANSPRVNVHCSGRKITTYFPGQNILEKPAPIFVAITILPLPPALNRRGRSSFFGRPAGNSRADSDGGSVVPFDSSIGKISTPGRREHPSLNSR